MSRSDGRRRRSPNPPDRTDRDPTGPDGYGRPSQRRHVDTRLVFGSVSTPPGPAALGPSHDPRTVPRHSDRPTAETTPVKRRMHLNRTCRRPRRRSRRVWEDGYPGPPSATTLRPVTGVHPQGRTRKGSPPPGTPPQKRSDDLDTHPTCRDGTDFPQHKVVPRCSLQNHLRRHLEYRLLTLRRLRYGSFSSFVLRRGELRRSHGRRLTLVHQAQLSNPSYEGRDHVRPCRTVPVEREGRELRDGQLLPTGPTRKSPVGTRHFLVATKSEPRTLRLLQNDHHLKSK